MASKVSRGRKIVKELSRRQRNTILHWVQVNLLSGDKRSTPSTLAEDNILSEIPIQHSENENTLPLPIADEPIVPVENINMDNGSISSPDYIMSDVDECFDDMSVGCVSQSSLDSISDDERPSFRNELAAWVVDNFINSVASDALLHILRSHPCFSNLPKSTKTLIGTPRQSAVLLDVPPGEYLHFGFEVALVNILENADHNKIPEILEVDISTDGAELDNSANNQIWPIQCRVANIPNSLTEVIGIYRGNKKPQNFEVFFQPFLDEANNLIHDGGVPFRGCLKPFIIRGFIADAPARASAMNHYGHAAENPCSKCYVTGVYKDRRMTLCGVDFRPRTDDQYSRREDEDHHKEGPCPLSSLPIGLVTQVPFEYMHLVLLGVVKRLLSAWVDGKFLNSSRLSAHDISLISMRLMHLSVYCPREFARRPRDLKYYSRYKATEFRQFLLYTGPTILFGILNNDLYEHFLLLHVSLRILRSSSPSEQQLFYARSALRIFVEQCPNLYGPAFVTYNVHGLLHLVDDVTFFGPVDKYSAFPYENNMQIFRKYCRKPDMPLQQIANRRAERAQRVNFDSRRDDCRTVALEKHNEGPLINDNVDEDVQQYRRLKCRKFVLTREKRDNCCILKDSSICIVVNIVVRHGENFLIVKKFDRIEEFYDVAIPSSSVSYFKCCALRQDVMLVGFEDVEAKCFLMPHWQTRRLDGNGRELLVDDVLVVATMQCEVNY